MFILDFLIAGTGAAICWFVGGRYTDFSDEFDENHRFRNYVVGSLVWALFLGATAVAKLWFYPHAL